VRWRDAWWVLAYPVYQTIGTARHELCHAAVAAAQGARITRVVPWPQTDLGFFTWGYTEWVGATGWPTLAAPYLGDLVWFLGFLVLCARVRNRALWLNLVVIGLVSPLVNSGYQWVVGFSAPGSDVGQLRQALPDPLVQAYFGLTLALYLVGLTVIVRRRNAAFTRSGPGRP
jgi:peptidase M50B-like protein